MRLFLVIYVCGFMVVLFFFYTLQYWRVAEGDEVAPRRIWPWFFLTSALWPLGALAVVLLGVLVVIAERIYPDLRRKKR